MICQKCKDADLKSIIKQISKRFLLEGSKIENYYDEDGRYHSHDHYGYLYIYKCSNNHLIYHKKTSMIAYNFMTPCCKPTNSEEFTYKNWTFWNRLGLY